MSLQSGRKRGREEDDEGLEFLGFDKRRRTFNITQDEYQPRSLPLRNSFPLFPGSAEYRPASGPGTSDESTDGSPDSTHSPPEFSDDIDMDDDTVSIAESQSPPTPIQGFARPAKLAPAPYRGQLAEGRVPTPIHNSFFTNGALGIPRSSSDGSNMDLEDVPLQTVRSPMAPPPRRTTLRDHPMPSPIRESLLSPGIPLRSPGSLHSPGPFHSPTTSGSMETSIAAASQMSRLSMNGSENMDIDDGRGGEDSGIDMSPRKGRARSGALSTQKTRYVMGYRDDCDKCRAKVPGHFSHFLPV